MEHPESPDIDETPYLDEIGEEIAQTRSPSTKKRKMKLRSKVRDHFVKMPLNPGESKEAAKARCLHCGKHFPCYGKIVGTSGMWQLYSRCPRLQRQRQTTIGEFQSKFTYDASSASGGEVGTLKLDAFDEKKVRKALAQFIILCELPFLLVEKPGSKSCTAHIFFRELERIKKQMDIFMMSEDDSFSGMAKKMHDKYAKYWGGFTTGHPRLRINRFLYVATVLEPKYKIRWFEYWFPMTLSDVHSKEAIAMVKQTVEDLFHEYNLIYGRSSTGPNEAGSSAAYSKGFGAFIAQITEFDQHTEFDQYLMERNEPLTASYDILQWWKLNESKYPVLARMARDVLAITITTVPSEAAFSTGGKVLSAFRSSLAPRTIEGLICTQNWMNEDIETEIYAQGDGTKDPDAYLLDSELESNPTNMVVGVGLGDLRIQDQSGTSVALES